MYDCIEVYGKNTKIRQKLSNFEFILVRFEANVFEFNCEEYKKEEKYVHKSVCI